MSQNRSQEKNLNLNPLKPSARCGRCGQFTLAWSGSRGLRIEPKTQEYSEFDPLFESVVLSEGKDGDWYQSFWRCLNRACDVHVVRIGQLPENWMSEPDWEQIAGILNEKE